MKKSFGSLSISFLLVIAVALTGCSKKVSQSSESSTLAPTPAPASMRPKVLNSEPVGMLLNASVFKMNGDYADNVAVTMGVDGRLVYFPSPSDISASSKPVPVGEGWYLNRQGLGPGSVFTKWTFEEYKALESVPSPAEIIAAIIPGARVTEFETLPVTVSEAADLSPEELLKLIK